MTALGDRLKIEQSVLNLVGNAVKFTPSGGRVTVSSGASSDRAFVTVEDTGPGIPAEKLREIFEPFVQLGRSLSSGHEGVGLGLAISRDLARAMGGDVTVDSTYGQGATFTLALPRADANAAASG
ncbi:MAG: sensor histidine kinase [Gemmatimonadaceae bacterium]